MTCFSRKLTIATGRFSKTNGHIGAYSTVDIDGGVSLRPTNEGCLMRDVTVPSKFVRSRLLHRVLIELLPSVLLGMSRRLNVVAPRTGITCRVKRDPLSVFRCDRQPHNDGCYSLKHYRRYIRHTLVQGNHGTAPFHQPDDAPSPKCSKSNNGSAMVYRRGGVEPAADSAGRTKRDEGAGEDLVSRM